MPICYDFPYETFGYLSNKAALVVLSRIFDFSNSTYLTTIEFLQILMELCLVTNKTQPRQNFNQTTGNNGRKMHMKTLIPLHLIFILHMTRLALTWASPLIIIQRIFFWQWNMESLHQSWKLYYVWQILPNIFHFHLC